jgi:transglutaminase-like putative cysteine protease
MKKVFLFACALLFVSSSVAQTAAQSVAQTAARSFPQYKYKPCTQKDSVETEYLKFLYDYMPLSDRADYDTSFFKAQVKTSIRARQTFRWGKQIPEEIFKHFVLVYRVNNENLDTAKMVMFNVLQERFAKIEKETGRELSMYDAALEVNHWCHEHMNYKASDGRTSSPLASMKTSWGRCGEESTFAVTALRAACIPARQCYTPRWAHTDDNHAWVEVWIDGKWYYLGACEPEPKLNVAWFTAPAKRAMMVHTTVFGKYNGTEECNFIHPLYSKVNLLSNYAPVKKLRIRVVENTRIHLDSRIQNEMRVVKNAEVSFGLYNYAEYYPLAKIKTDKDGFASLTTGYGDLVIWVAKGDKYAQKQVFASDTLVTVEIKKIDKKERTSSMMLTPPKELPIDVIDPKLEKENGRRLAYEDSLRNAYVATFADSAYIEKEVKYFNAGLLTYEHDQNHPASHPEIAVYDPIIRDLLKKSCGNYKEVRQLIHFGSKQGVDILKMLYDKDLRDLKSDVIMDHLRAAGAFETQDKISEYILNPRIQLEMITPWRSFLQKYFCAKAADFKSNPTNVSAWINKNIKLNNSDNYYGVPISPEGVIKIKEADMKSMEILFVAICRSFGIEARYEWATGKAQYRISADSPWQYAHIEGIVPSNMKSAKKSAEINNCTLVVDNDKNNSIKPEYYSQFTIQKLVDGAFKTLDYEYDPHFQNFPDTLRLSAGYYRLVVGSRNSNGAVQVSEKYFILKPDAVKRSVKTSAKNSAKISTKTSVTKIIVTLPKVKEEVKSLGVVDMQTIGIKDSITNNRPVAVAVIDGKEPSRHLIVDYEKSKTEFAKAGIKMIFIKADNESASGEKTINGKSVGNTLIGAANAKFLGNYPILVLLKSDGTIVYLSQGYKISSQEEILKVAAQLASE